MNNTLRNATLIALALLASGCGKTYYPDPIAEKSEVERIRKMITAGAATGGTTEAVVAGTGWGTLKGKIMLSAAPPKPIDLVCNKDEGVCCKEPKVDNTLIVGPTNGVEGVFVYLRSKKDVRVHDDYAKQEGTEVKLDNLKCMFVPPTVAVWTKQKLQIVNSDDTGHNTNYSSPTIGFNVILSKDPVIKTFTKGENKPSNIACSIHPWMQGKLLIRDNPYFAVTNAQGEFELPNLPAGEPLEIVVWHARNQAPNKADGDLKIAAGVIKTTLAENAVKEATFTFDPAEFAGK